MEIGCLSEAALLEAPGERYTTAFWIAPFCRASDPFEPGRVITFAAFGIAVVLIVSVFEIWPSAVTLPLTSPAARALETTVRYTAIRGKQNMIRWIFMAMFLSHGFVDI
jgi:uncharacterized membrane protein YdfJ with MMPL/SSD domain